MNVRDLDKRLSRLEAARHQVMPIRGVSGVLLACARYRAERRVRGVSDEEHEAAMALLPKPPWYENICNAMARHREGRQA